MKTLSLTRRFVSISLLAAMVLTPLTFARAQDPVTGALEGYVYDSANAPVADALVQFINIENGATLAKRTNAQGYYRQNLLPPGDYRIRATKQGYVTEEHVATNFATRPNPVQPPFHLKAESAAVAAATPEPSPAAGQPQPAASPAPQAATSPATGVAVVEERTIASEMNINDARRGGAYTDKELVTLPLGGSTLTRTFDELALLVPGVAPPPETQGSVAGPGVGPGVGSSGQFAVNGIRSRANNFTVDGSDNNDEDIGVRRQGFFALVPQPIESIRDFQITTLLAPAQYGRNMGAQVNAVSKSGGSDFHGTIYGFFNSSQLNATNAFDTTTGNFSSVLKAGTKSVLDCTNSSFSGGVCTTANGGVPITTTFTAGNKDSFTLGQGGFVLGGPLTEHPKPGHSAFFFVSAEGHILNATKEESFAVPTVAQRGIFGTGATGTFDSAGNLVFPTKIMGDAIFSLFPFPNNPAGIYGENTLTQALPDSAQGRIISGKFDASFKAFGKEQDFVARYNFTQDWRDIPVTGGAIFSGVRSRVRTQNFSTYLNTPDLTNSASNQLRLSYGRTFLNFTELRDPSLIPSQQSPNTPFLLNRTLLENGTLPGDAVVSYFRSGTTERGDTFLNDNFDFLCNTFSVCDLTGTGPLGQVVISGFSPVGVDVFTFPQQRVNNTYQLADTISMHRGKHNFAFGADVRRTELNSQLPRNQRPLAIFGGTPRKLQVGAQTFDLRPSDFAAAGAPTGMFATLASSDSTIHLRYYQLNFFGQDEFRIHRNLSLSFGVRYEYNTVPHESAALIEKTFNAPELSLLPDLKTFIAGRSQIFEPDRNNFAPRIGFAWSHTSASGRATVVRAGYGLYYDQILGSVISQSRNVYPTFLTLNTAGGSATAGSTLRNFVLFNPTYNVPGGLCNGLRVGGVFNCYVVTGSLNTLNDNFNNVVTFNRDNRTAAGFGLTLPERNIKTPMAHQYSATVEQEISRHLLISAAYVGTLGRNLLRLTTPNLGPNVILAPTSVTSGTAACNTLQLCEPTIFGTVLAPGNALRRPAPTAGPVNIFTSNAHSRYDALQVQARGRFARRVDFQANYTFSNAKDDASDFFDLAGSFSLPQDSVTFGGEYGPANFDVRHRVAYNYMIDLPWRIQLAGTGQFQTGQPFTVNSIFDVNLDGNLTDRLNSTTGIVSTGDRSQPYRLTVAPATLLAPVGQDGSVPRNSFRSTNLFVNNLGVIKTLQFTERYKLLIRADIFNIFDRANYGIPVRFLEEPGFGRSTYTTTPGRRIQFGLKFSF